MVLHLACVAYVLSGGLSYYSTQSNGAITLEYPPSSAVFITPPEHKDPASQRCTAHKTYKDAALSAYRKEELDDTLMVYEVNTETLTVKPLPRPTVRLEVEERK